MPRCLLRTGLITGKFLFNVINGPNKNLKFYIDWGTYEASIAFDGRSMRNALLEKGYENVLWKEWHEGHSWGSWYAHTDLALIHFFPDLTDAETNDRLPSEFKLMQNYPNPFNPVTTIKYNISERTFVNLSVYDILGRQTDILVNDEQSAGVYTINFNAGTRSSGIYFIKMKAVPTGGQAGSYTETIKMILLK